MRSRTAMIAAVLALSSATAAFAAVEHAGEWQSTIDNRPPQFFCLPADRVEDQAAMMKSMAQAPGAACQVNQFATRGPVTAFSFRCTLYGAVVTSSGMMTQTGPDAFTTQFRTHGERGPTMDGGQPRSVPDAETTLSARRVGPCKPGDRMETN